MLKLCQNQFFFMLQKNLPLGTEKSGKSFRLIRRIYHFSPSPMVTHFRRIYHFSPSPMVTHYSLRRFTPCSQGSWRSGSLFPRSFAFQACFADSYHMASSICSLRRFTPCSQGSWRIIFMCLVKFFHVLSQRFAAFDRHSIVNRSSNSA